MSVSHIARHKTAIRRHDFSRPVRLALADGIITQGTSVFDYGCGHGEDVALLAQRDITVSGWDPVHRPAGERTEADVVNLGYVVNVIESPQERVAALRSAWALARDTLIVSARLTLEAREDVHAFFADGCLTKRGTFQKFFEQQELKGWIEEHLGLSALAAAPGVFYIFRDEAKRHQFAAARYRRRLPIARTSRSSELYDAHRGLLDALVEFIAERGRPPIEGEFAKEAEVLQAFGSYSRAIGTIRRVSDVDWDRVREERSQELSVFLALSRFDGRPAYHELSPAMQGDVKAFFSTYKKACSLSDDLLFSLGRLDEVSRVCAESPVGKCTQEALYVHESSLTDLPALLKVYEGCARAYLGVVEGANLIKLSRKKPKVSYLYYPEFDTDPHPSLAGSLSVDLQTFRVTYRNYADSENPPILHRKEEFVGLSYPNREKFARLTKQEEKAGLLDDVLGIGTRDAWQQRLEARGYSLRGHQLRRS